MKNTVTPVQLHSTAEGRTPNKAPAVSVHNFRQSPPKNGGLGSAEEQDTTGDRCACDHDGLSVAHD